MQDFKSCQACLIEIEIVLKGDIVDFFQPDIYFVDVKQTVVDSRTELLNREVPEMPNFKDVRAILHRVLLTMMHRQLLTCSLFFSEL